jgi:protein phosphatase
MHVIAKTDTGLVRAENQDRVRYKIMEDGSAVVVVCDGMGGENAGSEASEIAVNAVFERIVSNYRHDADCNSIRNLLISSINAANAIVYEKSLSDESKIGMGTTCVCGIITKSLAYIANVGDSRAYKIDNNSIHQISKDHTYVQMLYENGEIEEHEIKTHHQRNIITRAVGIDDKIEPDYYEIEMSDNSVILMCTDGLSGYCSDEMLIETINSGNLEEAAEKLVKYAIEQGGKDNITIALVEN